MIKGVEDLPPVEIKPVRDMVRYAFLPQGQTVDQHVYKNILQRFFCSVTEKSKTCGKATRGYFNTIMRLHTLP